MLWVEVCFRAPSLTPLCTLTPMSTHTPLVHMLAVYSTHTPLVHMLAVYSTHTPLVHMLAHRETENRQDRSQLIISGQVGVVTGRLPGQLNGRQFHIQDCQKCQLFILDHTSAVTLHGCSECDVVLGPCAGRYIQSCKTDEKRVYIIIEVIVLHGQVHQHMCHVSPE